MRKKNSFIGVFKLFIMELGCMHLCKIVGFSKEEIYTSKVKYFIKRGRPYIWVPEKDSHNVVCFQFSLSSYDFFPYFNWLEVSICVPIFRLRILLSECFLAPNVELARHVYLAFEQFLVEFFGVPWFCSPDEKNNKIACWNLFVTNFMSR